MPNAIAFFPWVYIEQPTTIGPLRLLPYLYGQLPGDLPNVSQADIDGVLAAYSNRPNAPVKRGALLELGDWHSGMDVSQEQLSEMFRAKEALTFSALSKRVLFRGHFDYWNSDAYALVVQRFIPNDAGKFSFNTRRRDTGTRHFWSNDSFAFQRPHHTSANWQITLDEPLVGALLQVAAADDRIREALLEFNAANTDSSSVPEHVEIVMCKSAFELLFNIDEDAGSFLKAIKATLARLDLVKSEGPLKGSWEALWPNSDSPLIAWAREFCFVRNNAAHGNEKRKKLVWGERQHLAFVSILFPLLVQKVLSDKGLMPLADDTVEHLRHVEAYVLQDPFVHDFDDSDKAHPWAEIRQQARMSAIARKYNWGA